MDQVDRHMYKKDKERCTLVDLPWNPFVAGIINALDDPKNLYLLTEFIPCGSLRDIIQHRRNDEPLAAREAAFYFCNIIEGISFLHDEGVIHRDLKPDNILVGQDGYLVITDFGTVAKLGEPEADWKDVGTRFYTAPELDLLDGNSTIGKAGEDPMDRYSVDTYSAGVILFEMLTRRLVRFLSPTLERLNNPFDLITYTSLFLELLQGTCSSRSIMDQQA